jgi:hypothetical protein
MTQTAALCGRPVHCAEPALFAADAGSSVVTSPVSGRVRLLSRESAVAAVDVHGGDRIGRLRHVDLNRRRPRAREGHRRVVHGERTGVGGEGAVRERKRRDCGCGHQHRSETLFHVVPFRFS